MSLPFPAVVSNLSTAKFRQYVLQAIFNGLKPAGNNGGAYVAASGSAPAGTYSAVYVVTAGTITTLTGSLTNWSASASIPAGTWIYGNFTAVGTGTATVIAYV
jgi:hypothetical protein